MKLEKVLANLLDAVAGTTAGLSIVPALLSYALGVFTALIIRAFKDGYHHI